MIQEELIKRIRKQKGKNENPTYVLIDSQSVKTAASNEKRGYDGGKNKRKKATHSHRYCG